MTDEKFKTFSSTLECFEISLITGNFTTLKNLTEDITALDIDSDFVRELLIICNCVKESDYETVLSASTLVKFADACVDVTEHSFSVEICKFLRNLINDNVGACEYSSIAAEYILLLIGVSALQEFVSCNWTGPNQDKKKIFQFVNKIFVHVPQSAIKKHLSSSGESIYEHVNNPELLLFSKLILGLLIKDDSTSTRDWWLLRCSMIQQYILLEKSGDLYKKMKDIVDKLHRCDILCSNNSLHLQLNIESGHVYLYYHEIISAKKYFDKAQEIVGFDMEVSGALGKRTQFQSKAVAQLLLKFGKDAYREGKPIVPDMPKDVALDDEVLLNKINFIENEDNSIPALLPEEQIVILAQCCLIQKSDASDELLTEKLMAYIDYLLYKPTVWGIAMKSLVMRSKLEQHKSRKIERAMKQLESLISVIREDNSNLQDRLYMFYSILFPPFWIIEKNLADLLYSLGATKSALDVYLRLELWSDVVNCYKSLGLIGKAAEIVQQQLNKGPTPLLWCILGDVTEDINCYEEAWKLSGHHNSRSQSSLGYYYYKKQEYEKSIEYFERSLKINHLQLNVWFSLAFASTQVGKYELAAQAYRHVVVMDPENFQAWNNLSNAYIKLKQKDRAYKTLQEAIKCNFEDWRIWENFILVCMDIGAFEDAIHAYHRLLDLKGKHEDTEVLTILVKAIETNVLDSNGLLASRLRPKAQKLFGRLTSLVPTNADVWKLYASLHLSDIENAKSKDMMERIVSYQQKAHKFYVQKPNWERDVSMCHLIISHAIELGRNYLYYMQLLDGNIKIQTKSSAKLMLRNLLVRIEKQLCDLQPVDAENLEQLLQTLRQTLSDVEAVQ